MREFTSQAHKLGLDMDMEVLGLVGFDQQDCPGQLVLPAHHLQQQQQQAGSLAASEHVLLFAAHAPTA